MESLSRFRISLRSRRLEVMGERDVAGAWKLWAKERTGTREGDTPRVRERLHGRPPKIVSTRTL